MVLPTQCTVAYTVTAVPSVAPLSLEAAVAAVVLDGDPALDSGLASSVADSTSVVGRNVTRTLVYLLTPLYFDSFPNLDVSAFVQLWTARLSAKLNSKVTAAAPLLG